MKKRKYVSTKKPSKTGRSTSDDIAEGERTFMMIELRALELKQNDERKKHPVHTRKTK